MIHFHCEDFSVKAAFIMPTGSGMIFWYSSLNTKYLIMERMINLKDLLMHEVLDLYSAEEQIIEALPSMIEKANNNQLKKALQDHLKVTEKQKARLDQVKQLLGSEEEEGEGEEKKGVFSRLFGGGSHKCKGTEGLIKEGEKIMGENMTTEVRDAAIIASAQKIEHYEICGYGTARAFARELNMGEVAELLEQTLNEEYEADDLLTDLAVGRLNEEAEKGRGNGRGRNSNSSSNGGGGAGNGRSKSNGSARSSSGGAKSSSSSGSAKSSSSSSRGAKSAASKSSSGKSGGSKASKSSSGSRGGSKSASSSRGKSSAGRSRSSRAKSK
jgi:ferritin-like metal-binding protein YciE